MKIYGMPGSTNVQRVLATMAEKGHAPRFELVDLAAGAQKQPAHLARHPFGKIPALVEDDGFTLFESRAIMRYLDRRLDGPSLTPADARGQALMEQWLSVGSCYLDSVVTIRRNLVWGRFLGLPTDLDEVARAKADVGRVFDVVDRALRRARFLAGDALSLADLALLPDVESMSELPQVADLVLERPELRRWHAELRARPAWQAVTAQARAARPAAASTVATALTV